MDRRVIEQKLETLRYCVNRVADRCPKHAGGFCQDSRAQPVPLGLSIWREPRLRKLSPEWLRQCCPALVKKRLRRTHLQRLDAARKTLRIGEQPRPRLFQRLQHGHAVDVFGLLHGSAPGFRCRLQHRQIQDVADRPHDRPASIVIRINAGQWHVSFATEDDAIYPKPAEIQAELSQWG